jgi:hypothetical protein
MQGLLNAAAAERATASTGHCEHGRPEGAMQGLLTAAAASTGAGGGGGARTAERSCCEHGRRKDMCKDCDTGYCQHGRPKHAYKDCGTGHCQHGRRKHQCSRTAARATASTGAGGGNARTAERSCHNAAEHR